jgi:hypothetical protein
MDTNIYYNYLQLQYCPGGKRKVEKEREINKVLNRNPEAFHELYHDEFSLLVSHHTP